MSKEETPPESADRAEKQRLYRQRYWERFSQTRKRVYGTLTAEEYARAEERAERAGRAVWSQIHAEAEAYARGEYLPPRDIEERISDLIVQLRRIGNNVNQVARQVNAGGELNEDRYVQSLEELEAVIRNFVRRPWGDESEDNDPAP